jgi:methionine-rich copper-binding protein CopC
MSESLTKSETATARKKGWLPLLAGVRLSSFHGDVSEDVADPFFGTTVTVPRLGWVLRGFYGRYYQAPAWASIMGPLLSYANANNTGFTPLRGERDEEHEFGIQIPYRVWALEVDNFKTRINNFLDHSYIGESNVYIPITVDGALVRAWEASPRSPMVWRRGKFNLTHSNQTAEQQSAIAGGLICVQDCDESFDCSPVDHDWRGTLNTGFTANLLMRTWSSSNVYNGSGFSNRTAGIADSNGALISPYQGDYLPAHTTFDVSARKSFGESLRLAVDVRNFVIDSTSERDAETSIKSSCKNNFMRSIHYNLGENMDQLKATFRPVVVIFSLMLTVVPSAFAHAHPKTMVPAPDSTGPAPSKISITFSEAVEPKFSSIKLTNIEGKPADPETSAPVPGDPTTITLAASSLPAGTYVVHWVDVSVDGHRLQGSYQFTVR